MELGLAKSHHQRRSRYQIDQIQIMEELEKLRHVVGSSTASFNAMEGSVYLREGDNNLTSE
jgi:hypothetical protein